MDDKHKIKEIIDAIKAIKKEHGFNNEEKTKEIKANKFSALVIILVFGCGKVASPKINSVPLL
jgi:hypothetical protein